MVRRNTVILNTIARALNAGGCVLVTALDGGAAAFNCTMSALSPGEKSKLASRIKVFEKKVQELSIGIAREAAKYPDPSAALALDSVAATINNIKELNIEIGLMKQRIAELDTAKGVKKSQQESTGVPGCIAQTLSGILPGEKASLQHKIGANEKKIQALYGDFAREAAKQADPSAAMASSAVTGIVAKINELKAENDALKLKMADLAKPKADKPKAAAAPTEKKAQPESTGVGKFFMQAISQTISGYLPGEKSKVEHALAEHEKKIQGLYVEVAKESAKFADPADALTAEPVIALLAKINDLKAAIATLSQHKDELSVPKKVEVPKVAVAVDVAATVNAEKPLEPEVPTDVAVSSETSAVEPADSGVEESADSGAEVNDTAEHCSEIPMPVNGVMPDDNEYARERRKQSLIPVPTLEPPTKEDIESTIREIQATDIGEAEASILQEEQETVQEESVATSEAVEAAKNTETDAVTEDTTEVEQAETASADNADEIVPEAAAVEETLTTREETAAANRESDIVETSLDAELEPPPSVPVDGLEEAGYDTAAAPNDAPETTVQETTSEAEASESTDAEEALAAEDSETSTETAVETETAPEAATDSEVAVSTPSEASEPVTPAAEKTQAEAATVRTGFFGAEASRPDTFFSDKSEPVFRTRVYRNEFSILTAEPVAQKIDTSEVVEESVDATVDVTAAEEVSELQDMAIENASKEVTEATAEETSEEEAEAADSDEDGETSLDEDESAAGELSGADDEPTLQKRPYGRKKAVLSDEKVSGKDSSKKRK